jgi:hypothetical protein
MNINFKNEVSQLIHKISKAKSVDFENQTYFRITSTTFCVEYELKESNALNNSQT